MMAIMFEYVINGKQRGAIFPDSTDRLKIARFPLVTDL